MNGPNKLEYYVTLSGKVCQVQTLKLIEPICKLQRKWSDVSKTPGTVFTTVHFIRNL